MKNWIDLDAQLKKHIDRGLDMSGTTDREFKLFLYSSNFYRVSGYGHCFYEPGTDRYVGGTTARQIMDVYDLDRRVRNLVLDGIGVVEPTIRSRVAYQVSKAVGGDGYLVPDLYLPLDTEPNPDDKRRPAQINNRDKVLDAFAQIQRRDEIFIQHHIAKGEPVPFWAAIEVVSIGTFSRFLRALRDKSVLAPVATSVGIDDVDKFLQAVQNLAFLRNIAAHHGRLWNRRFGVT
ncbi:MAG: Abi family protein [Dermabacter sp.]|nr:Abi family protein [Dermabacter sp.]